MTVDLRLGAVIAVIALVFMLLRARPPAPRSWSLTDLNPPQYARALAAQELGWTYEPVAAVVPCITPKGTMSFRTRGLNVVRGRQHDVAFEAFEFTGWSFARMTLSALAGRGRTVPGLVTVTLPVEVPDRLTIIRRREGRTTRVDGPFADGYGFESIAFNERYIVWSELPRKLTTDLITPRAIEWLMWAPEDFAFLVWGRTAFAPLPRGASADTVGIYASALTAIVAAVPSFVWSDLMGASDRDASGGGA